MERVVYDQMAELDERHWWYKARREVLAALIRRLASLPPGGQILEIGCGTGHNLPMLSGFGHVDALELDDAMRGLAEKRLGRERMLFNARAAIERYRTLYAAGGAGGLMRREGGSTV